MMEHKKKDVCVESIEEAKKGTRYEVQGTRRMTEGEATDKVIATASNGKQEATQSKRQLHKLKLPFC